MTSNTQLAEKQALREGAISHTRLSAIAPMTDRCLSDRIMGKRVIFSFCDNHFDEGAKLIGEMVSHSFLPQGMEPMRWSDLLRELPFLKADIVIVFSLPPEEVLRDPEAMAASLKHFKERNPNSSFVMLSLYGSTTPAGAVFSFLENERLVDRVEQGPASYDVLIRHGADLHELKTL
jgi:hypothetical protein